MCSVAQSCPTLCDPIDCSPLGSYVYGIFQAMILEWVAISFSRESSQHREHASLCISCIGRQVLYHWCHRGSPVLLLLWRPNPTWLTKCCQTHTRHTHTLTYLLMFHGIRSSMMVQILELSLPPLGFGPPLTVTSRLLCPHNTEDKTPRLMVKQLLQSGTPKELHRVI